jgi:general secretion pathway protein C
MSQSSDKTILFLVKYMLIPAVAIKLIYSISLFYLDKDLLPQSDSGNISFITKTKLAYKVLDTTKAEPVKQEVVETGKKITDFKLKGTYVSGDDSFVIIDDAGSTEFIYMGESYQGYKLIKVYENKAIFDKDGTTYELTMYSDTNKSYTTNEPIKKSSKKTSSDGDYVVPIDVDKEDITYYSQNPDKIWNNIRIRDYRTENGLEFKVGYVRRGTVFDKIGLKAGDVITSIDGQVPQSMADVMKYYNEVNDIDSLILTIKRKDQEMDLEFRIKE